VTFKEWYEKKRFMFSPKELAALRDGDPAVVGAARRVWQDDEAKRPRRRAVIFIPMDQKDVALELVRKLSPFSEDVGWGLSSTGKGMPTHLIAGWNCSYSEYQLLRGMMVGKMEIFDGHEKTVEEVLELKGLKVIGPDRELAVTGG